VTGDNDYAETSTTQVPGGSLQVGGPK